MSKAAVRMNGEIGDRLKHPYGGGGYSNRI